MQQRCYACDKAQREAWLAAEEKHCSGCGAELDPERRSRWCSECRYFYRQHQLRQLRQRPDRACNRCGAKLVVGQWSNQCSACQKQRRLELAQAGQRQREGRSRKRCADCRAFLPNGRVDRYCLRCRRDYNKIYWTSNGERYRQQWRQERQQRRKEGEARHESESATR